MQAYFKSLCLVVALVLLSSLMPANGAFAEVDMAKEIKIVGYLLGAAPAGMPEVMEQLNDKLKADLNMTMEIRHIGWGDFQAKYPLVLAAGDDIDWIFTANWAFYFQEAAKGAFYELTDEMFQEYMPLHYAALAKHAYNEMKVDGKMYMIPTSTPDRKVPVILIRGDLRKKYGVPEVTKISEIEPYLAAIKENEPGMTPMYLDNSYDLGQSFGNLFKEQGNGFIDVLATTGGGSGLGWSLEDPSGKLLYMLDEPQLTQYKNAAATVQSWYNNGYINRDVFSNKVQSKDSFMQGKSGVAFANSQYAQAALADAEAKGWEIEVIPMLNGASHYQADPHINNGLALAATTKYPERTLMALDLIMEDEAYNYLVYFGIEGKNYAVKDGKVGMPEGVTAEENTYPPDQAGFWFTNKDMFLPLESWDDAYIQLRQEIKEKYLVAHPLTTFPPQTENVKSQIATLNQAIVQYLNPIMVGMVKDVDKAFETLDKQLKAAGVEDVRAELQEQVDEYMKAMQ